MRKTSKRARRGPSFGWQVAHARLEDRLLLSGTPAETSTTATTSSSATEFVIHLDLASSTDRGATSGSAVLRDPGGATASTAPGGVTASKDAWAAASFGTAPAVYVAGFTPPPVIFSDSGGASFTITSDATSSGFSVPITPPTHVSPGAVGMFQVEGMGPFGSPQGLFEAMRGGGPGDPTMIGDPIGPRAAGIESPVLQRMEDHLFSFQPVGDAAPGIFPADPAASCVSMASIVGNVEADVVVLAPPAPPIGGLGAAMPMSIAVKASEVPVEVSAPVGGTAGPARGAVAVAVAAPSGAPAPVPVADDPAVESPSSGEESGPAELPAPIGLGLRLTAPFLDATGWDEALGQLVEGVDGLLGGLDDLGGEAGYLPWVVAAGAAVTATEVARRARARPGFAAALVGGSVEAVDPVGAPRGRTRGAMLSDSVRRLLARGMSRWTTRR